MIDNDSHYDVGSPVKNTGNQHHQPDGHNRDARVVGVKQGQQSGDHAKDDVAGGIAATVGNPGAYRQALGLMKELYMSYLTTSSYTIL